MQLATGAGSTAGPACSTVVDGLFKVMSERLVELRRGVRRRAAEPLREALLQRGPTLTGNALIRRHPDEGVTEPEGDRARVLDESASAPST